MADFDFDGALKAGYNHDEILRYLASPEGQRMPPQQLAATPADRLRGMVADASARNATRDRVINTRDFRPWQEPDNPPARQTPPVRFQPDLKSGALGMVNPEAGIENIIAGGKKMWQPSGTTADNPEFWNTKAEGTAQALRGVGTFGTLAAPLGFPAAAAAPVETIAGLAGGAAAQYGTDRALEAAGVPEGQRELFSNAAGFYGGGIGSQFGPKQLNEVTSRAGDLYRSAEDALNYSGGNPERGSFSRDTPRVKNAAGETVRGTMGGPKGKTYIPLQEDIEAQAQRLRPDNPEAAMRLAEAAVKWRNWGQAAAETKYGELVRSRATDSKLRKLQNTPAAVQRRIQRTNDFLARPTEPWTPKDYGIFDRSKIKDAMEGFPGVEQTSFPRTVAPRADLGYIDEIYTDPVNRDLIERQIKRGLPLGGETFYPSLYPVKAEAIARNLKSPHFEETGGDLYNNWVYSTAPGSARNSIYNERAVGNLLRNMKARGIPLTDENVTKEMAIFKAATGKGLPLMPVHTQGAAKVLEQGISPIDVLKGNLTGTYKIPTYAANQTGNFGRSWTGDVHEAAGETLGSRFNPYFKAAGGFGKNEYGPAERHFLSIADEMRLPGGTAQAGRWFGGGEMTGLLSPRGDSLDLLERQAAYTLHEAGQRTDPVSVRNYVMKLLQEGGDMLPWQKKKEMPDYREFARGSGRRAPTAAAPRGKTSLKTLLQSPEPRTPKADDLFHGTSSKTLRSIHEGGISSIGSASYVSPFPEIAADVARERVYGLDPNGNVVTKAVGKGGEPVLLVLDRKALRDAGVKFARDPEMAQGRSFDIAGLMTRFDSNDIPRGAIKHAYIGEAEVRDAINAYQEAKSRLAKRTGRE